MALPASLHKLEPEAQNWEMFRHASSGRAQALATGLSSIWMRFSSALDYFDLVEKMFWGQTNLTPHKDGKHFSADYHVLSMLFQLTQLPDLVEQLPRNDDVSYFVCSLCVLQTTV